MMICERLKGWEVVQVWCDRLVRSFRSSISHLHLFLCPSSVGFFVQASSFFLAATWLWCVFIFWHSEGRAAADSLRLVSLKSRREHRTIFTNTDTRRGRSMFEASGFPLVLLDLGCVLLGMYRKCHSPSVYGSTDVYCFVYTRSCLLCYVLIEMICKYRERDNCNQARKAVFF